MSAETRNPARRVLNMAPPAQSGDVPRRGRWLGAALIAAVFVLLTGAVVLTGKVGTGESADQVNYHVPVIRAFAESMPTPDLTRYESATTPGYHLMMAVVWKATGAAARWPSTPVAPVGAGPTAEYPAVALTEPQRAAWSAFLRDLRPMQFINILLSAGLLLTVYLVAARSVVWWVAAMVTLPLAMNQYVMGAAIWLTTDNAAWWFAFAALGAAMEMTGAGGVVRAGVWAVLAVLVRQVHLWVCGPIAAAGGLVWFLGARERRARTLAATVLACAVPTVVVAGFVVAWKGLTPPSERIREVHGHGINLAAIPFALSLVAAYAVFFVGAWRDQVQALRKHSGLVAAVVVVGVALALMTATSTQQPTLTDPPQRGYGWLWKASGMLPAVGGRSPLFVALAPCGLLAVMMLFRAARERGNARGAVILIVGMACWLAAQVVNPAAWQRYFDPVVLGSLAWLAALGVPAVRLRGLAIGAAVLGLFMTGLSYRSIWRDLSKNALPFDGGVLKMQGKLDAAAVP